MDSGAASNNASQENEELTSSNAAQKKGRGRPKKSSTPKKGSSGSRSRSKKAKVTLKNEEDHQRAHPKLQKNPKSRRNLKLLYLLVPANKRKRSPMNQPRESATNHQTPLQRNPHPKSHRIKYHQESRNEVDHQKQEKQRRQRQLLKRLAQVNNEVVPKKVLTPQMRSHHQTKRRKSLIKNALYQNKSEIYLFKSASPRKQIFNLIDHHLIKPSFYFSVFSSFARMFVCICRSRH